MGQPNIFPQSPAFHRINSQVVTRTETGDWQVVLEIFREDPDHIETVVFEVPAAVCNRPLTTFSVGLHVQHGWALSFEEIKEVQVTQTQKVVSLLPAKKK